MENLLVKKVDNIMDTIEMDPVEIKLYSKLIKKNTVENSEEDNAIANDLFDQLVDKKGANYKQSIS